MAEIRLSRFLSDIGCCSLFFRLFRIQRLQIDIKRNVGVGGDASTSPPVSVAALSSMMRQPKVIESPSGSSTETPAL